MHGASTFEPRGLRLAGALAVLTALLAVIFAGAATSGSASAVQVAPRSTDRMIRSPIRGCAAFFTGKSGDHVVPET